MNGLADLSNSSTVADHFYCDYTRNQTSPSCLSLSQFSSSPLDQLCPTKNCLEACQDLERLYEVVPSGLQVQAGKYGSADNGSEFVTLYGLCAGYSNISRALNDNTLPADQVNLVKPYFSSTVESDLRHSTNVVTQCLSDTCEKSVDSSSCTATCSPAQLLLNSTTPNLLGAQACFVQLCNRTSALPFGNQDVVGPGVTISYIIQSILVLLCWLGLAIVSTVSYKWPHRSKSSEKAMDVFLKSLDGFLKAQCYFSIPIAVATLLTDVFHLDPLNGYGFLPVAINGFLAQTFTLLQLHRHKRFSGYLSTLVFISWLLSTIILWAIINYLTARPIGQRDFEFRSLSQIDSCGGSSALALCEQRLNKSPLAYLFYQVVSVTGYGRTLLFGTTKIGTLIVPTIWVFCTMCLMMLLGHQCFGSQGLGFFASRDDSSRPTVRPHGEGWQDRFRHLFSHPWTGMIGFYLASCMFFLSTGYQALLFYNYLGLKLVDLSGWSFGQIIAIVVWVPVLADYFHLQFKASAPVIKTLYLSRSAPASGNQNQDQDRQGLLNKTNVWTMEPLTQHKNHAYQRLSDDFSRPSQLQPQGQQADKIPSDEPGHDGYLSNTQASGGQADGFELRSLTGVSE